MGLLKGKSDIGFVDIDYKVVNNIKALVLDTFFNSNLVYSGISNSLASFLYVLYKDHLNVNLKGDNWVNEDKLVLVNDEFLPLVYATSYMCGLSDDLNLLKNFDTNISSSYFKRGTLSLACGMALASSYLNKRYKYKNNNSLTDNYVYVLCDASDLMRGDSYEALEMVKSLGLSKFIVICNNSNSYDFSKSFLSSYNIVYVNNGDDLEEINKAILDCKASSLSSFIVVNTKLSFDDASSFKKSNSLLDVAFSVSNDAYEYFKSVVLDRLKKTRLNYDKVVSKLLIDMDPNYRLELSNFGSFSSDLVLKGCDIDNLANLDGETAANFILNDIILNNALVYNLSFLDFNKRCYCIGDIANGMTLSGVRSFTSLPISYVDYLRTSIKYAVLNELCGVYIFKVCEDYNEYISILRTIPNLTLFTPCDVNELIGSFKASIDNTSSVSVIIVNDKLMPVYPDTNIKKVFKGAYVLRDYEEIDGVLVASGENIVKALEVEELLFKKGLKFRIVSLVSIDKFLKQSDKYVSNIIPDDFKCFIMNDEVLDCNIFSKENVYFVKSLVYDKDKNSNLEYNTLVIEEIEKILKK